ncbi:antichymotrypsin-2-like isoform X2 [Plodia interpunctella]|uniref:antichymotrypsin-2-like isoform X2 n=1 Tax=Plodia interpunctella TaxID=58824 RepID=UPI0023675E28|nr:antichymotrypsin-2-like isoform X2 [Plodia interpunctella]
MWKLLMLAAILANTHFANSETCGANATYVDCPAAQCRPKTCAAVGFPIACPALAEDGNCPGEPGCICDVGYVKNDKGVCILATKCPSCGGDKNARSGCGVNCNKHCSDIGQGPKACILICYSNSCDCKDGFYLNSKGKCVKPDQCDTQPKCPENEEFSNCTNGGCDARNCSQLGNPVPCVKLDPDACKKGCVCANGYLRTDNGSCILKSQCPSCGGDKNAQAGCGINCNKHCSDIGQEPKACIKLCRVNACDCKDGYYLNDDGKCVKPEKCTQTTPPTNSTNCSTGYCKDDDPQDCLTTGNIDFTLDFLHQAIKINSGKSIVMSPFSVLFPLAQLALATDCGESFNQLMSALNLNNKDQIRKIFPALLSLVQAQQQVILDLEAKTYVSNNAVLTNTFEDDSVDVFGSKAETLDFSDTQNAADTINDWVDEVTNGLIQDLVSPNMFSKYTRIVLINAIYFLGNWETQFNPNLTHTQDFYITKDDTVPVEIMFRKGSYKYANSSSLDAEILEIPYKGGNFSYVLFLPNEIDGYATVAEKIKDTDVLNAELNSLSYETCQLYLPRHNITTTLDLTDILEKLNITDIFDSSKSGLTGILDSTENLSVTSAIQKANIRVNEVGTEAAAANAFVVGTTSVILNQIVVKADHPFLFLLMMNKNPLFCGIYAGN